MTRLHRTAFFLLAATLLAAPAWAGNPVQAKQTILIIRHGEKPAKGLGQLDCQGLNRALALPYVINSRFGTPQELFAPNPTVDTLDDGVYYPYIRPLATIEPLAIRMGEPVNIEWGMENYARLASYLLTKRSGLYVVAWEHHDGEALAKLLLTTLNSPDANKVPKWHSTDFDSIYLIQITTTAGGERNAIFRHEYEQLNGEPTVCPGPPAAHG